MSGTISFHRSKRGEGGRLCIGWRKRGMSPIWYEPIGSREDGDTWDIALFNYPTGPPGDKEPMPGEVIWHPWYNVTSAESSSKREQAIIQKQDLDDFYRYLIEKDPAKVAEMEQALNDPGLTRRFAFLQCAKVWKRKDMRARRKRRDARAGVANAAGLSMDDLDINSDSSDDSGIEMEETRARHREKKRRREEMPPPPRPDGSANKKKKKAKGATGGGDHRARQRPHETSDLDDVNAPLFVGSGGLGSRDQSQAPDPHQSPNVVNRREQSLDLFDFDARPPSDDNGRADSPLARPGFNYAFPTVETASKSSGSEARARRRASGQRSHTGAGNDDLLRESSREASQSASQHGLDGFGKKFGAGRVLGGNAAASRQPSPRLNWTGQTSAGYGALNGDLDDDAALLEGIRQRGQPPPAPQASNNRERTPSNEGMAKLLNGETLGAPSRPPAPIRENDESEQNDANAETGGSRAGSQANVFGGQTHNLGEDKDDAGADQPRIKRESAGDGEEQVEGANGETTTSGGNGEANDENGEDSEANGENNGDEVDEGLGGDGN